MNKCVERNIYSIYVEMNSNPLKYLNAYLIMGSSRNLLIDTGFNTPGCYASLTEGLREFGVSMDETDVFLTHMHSDHAGLASVIASPSTKIYLGKRDIETMRALNSDEGKKDRYSYMLRNGYTEEQIAESPFSPSRNLHTEPCDGFVPVCEGDVFSYGGHKFKAILTCGHTPGHMCLYSEDEEILFLGDHVLFDVTPNITFWPNFDDSLSQYIKSLMKIRDVPVRLALPGHRETGPSLSERVDEIIEHHADRVNEVLEALESHPEGITAYDIAGEMSWNIHTEKQGWENFPPNQKWFAIGETVAHLDYLENRGQIASCIRRKAKYYSKLALHN